MEKVNQIIAKAVNFIKAIPRNISSALKQNYINYKKSSFNKFLIKQKNRVTRKLRQWGKNYLIWLIVVGLIVAAEATQIWAPHVGIYINALALAGLCALAIIKEKARKVAISAAIIPVANMVTASVMPHTIIGSTVILYTVILLLALIYRFMFTLDYPQINTSLRIKGYGYGIPIMVVTGQVIGVIGYLFLKNHYPFVGYSLPLIALASVVFAFTEEMLLRGLIQQQGEFIFNPFMAGLATTILYVFLVIDHSTMLTLPVAIILGGTLSYTYYKRKNIILTFIINATSKLIYIALVASFILRK